MTDVLKFVSLVFLQALLQVNVCNSAACADHTPIGASLFPLETTATTGFLNAIVDDKARSTVMIGYSITCCGVVKGWEYHPYSPCLALGASCSMNFSVWSDFAPLDMVLVGVNLNISIKSAGFENISSSEQIPVQPGQSLGWDGVRNVVYTVDEPNSQGTSFCNLGLCNDNYIQTDSGKQIQSFNVGQKYQFFESGQGNAAGTTRYSAIRAILGPGATPVLSFSPTAPTIPSTTPIGTSVLTVTKSDLNTKDTLTSTFVRSCPPTSLFSYNSTTGVVTLSGSLNSSAFTTHALTFDVSDGCHTSTQTVNITIIDPVTTTTSFTSTSTVTTTTATLTTIGPDGSGLLATTDGKILVGLLAATLGLATAACLGLCCACCFLKGCCGSCLGSGAGSFGGAQAASSNMYYNDVVQTNPLLSKPSTNPLTSNYIEPRPPSYRNDEIRETTNRVIRRENSNRIRPAPTQERMNEVNSSATPRDVHVRPVSPNQFYRDQLFW